MSFPCCMSYAAYFTRSSSLGDASLLVLPHLAHSNITTGQNVTTGRRQSRPSCPSRLQSRAATIPIRLNVDGQHRTVDTECLWTKEVYKQERPVHKRVIIWKRLISNCMNLSNNSVHSQTARCVLGACRKRAIFSVFSLQQWYSSRFSGIGHLLLRRVRIQDATGLDYQCSAMNS